MYLYLKFDEIRNDYLTQTLAFLAKVEKINFKKIELTHLFLREFAHMYVISNYIIFFIRSRLNQLHIYNVCKKMRASKNIEIAF